MAQIPSLDNAAINLNSIRDHARKELIDALDTMRGKKLLVLDPRLSGPLSLIALMSLLKEHGVENLYHLSDNPVTADCENILYLVRPRIRSMRMVAAQVRHDSKEKIRRQYSVFFMPRRTIVCDKVLEEEGVFGDVTINEYTLDLIPFDEDVLSLELELAYKECLVDGDRSSLYYVARALAKLQSVFGLIPHVKGKGKTAKMVYDMMMRMRREQLGAVPPAGWSEIDTLVLFDRQVDMVTPMCSQLTYEGLIDEFLNISNGAVEVDSSVMAAQPQGPAATPASKKVKVPLNSSDKLFRELRDVNFSIVGQMLRQKATAMKEDYKEVGNQSVSELKEFVKKLNTLPEITRHTNLAQHLSKFSTTAPFLNRLSMEQSLIEARNYDLVSTYTEDLIHKQEPLMSVLRLLCLFSITGGGVPKKQFEYFRRELLQTYGYEHLFTLNNLEKAGLFRVQEGKSPWPLIKKSLRLAVEDNDDSNPKDIAYVYSGYAPMSIRLVQHALKGGWGAIDETLRLLPGPAFQKKQLLDASIQSDSPADHFHYENAGAGQDGRRSLVLVVFIGGVTFAEISALRFLSKQEDMKCDFIVATTKLVNGSSLLETLTDDPLSLR